MVQDLLVKMLANVTASTAMNARASQLQDAGMLRDEHASLCKAHSTVRMRETVGWAREVLGGNGILLEHHVGPLRGRRRGDLLLRGHPRDQHPHRRSRDHRGERVRLAPV